MARRYSRGEPTVAPAAMTAARPRAAAGPSSHLDVIAG
jgi:hypothetical protein